MNIETKANRKTHNMIAEDMETIRFGRSGQLVFHNLCVNEVSNIHGPVIPIDKIKSWFSRIHHDQRSNPIHPRLAYWRAKPIQSLRAHFTAEIPVKTKAFKLAKLIFEKEQSLENSDGFGFKSGEYFPNENEMDIRINDEITVSDEEDEEEDENNDDESLSEESSEESSSSDESSEESEESEESESSSVDD